MLFRCPICRKVVPSALNDKEASGNVERNKYFPFCSQRCKLLDVGAWLNADYGIPVDDVDQYSKEVDGAKAREDG